MMEKYGVIDGNTPRPDGDCKQGSCGCHGQAQTQSQQPTTKEAADRLEQHTLNDLIDEVADASK